MAIMDSYQRKAGITTKMLNSLKGVSCNAVTGSLYAFPKVILPQKAIEEAKVSCWRSSSKPIVTRLKQQRWTVRSTRTAIN